VIYVHKKQNSTGLQLTVEGGRIDHPGETATKNVDLTTSIFLWNSTISTDNAMYMCANVKRFYLSTMLDRPEYMRLALTIIPQEIIDKDSLLEKAKNGHVYIRIDKGMYGLTQSGRLANDLLIKRLAPHGYHPVKHTHGVWRHETRRVTFTLIVDDFGVKYVGREYANHLLDTLKKYCGISLDWDYKNKTVDLSMTGYIDNALHKFQHKPPDRPQHAPYPARKRQYGNTAQRCN
jgi:hypothetical protein